MSDIRPKVDWTINLGELISITTLVIIGFVFILDMKSDIRTNRDAIEVNRKDIIQAREDQQISNKRLLDAIYHLSGKIDRLSERMDGKADR